MEPSNVEDHGYAADFTTLFVDEPKDHEAGKTNPETPSSKSDPEKQHEFDYTQPSHNITFAGPYQDDSTFTVFCGLKTIPARFLVWFNLPLCWFIGITIATRHVETWLNAHFPGPESTAAIVFVVVYLVYTILSHTVGVLGAVVCELGWNPYARAPTLRGKVGREEKIAMVKRNRAIARQMCRCLIPCI